MQRTDITVRFKHPGDTSPDAVPVIGLLVSDDPQVGGGPSWRDSNPLLWRQSEAGKRLRVLRGNGKTALLTDAADTRGVLPGQPYELEIRSGPDRFRLIGSALVGTHTAGGSRRILEFQFQNVLMG
ncbi:MAG: hypothetical protein K2X35_18570 [Bryobacteraceae bacterium]|nr:hypothetical protein [Bryobacteraceae bacterium]